eukprot:scaffold281995_cov15-Prasinocladus_malaysianus.AAC.1
MRFLKAPSGQARAASPRSALAVSLNATSHRLESTRLTKFYGDLCTPEHSNYAGGKMSCSWPPSDALKQIK